MEHLVVLTVGTALIAILALFLWIYTRQLSLLVGVFFLYFWSLYGAWFVIGDELSFFHVVGYANVQRALVDVRLDDDYLWSLVLYIGFLLVFELVLLLGAPARGANAGVKRSIRISHRAILTVAISCTVLSYLLVRPGFEEALRKGMSVYSTTAGYATGMGGSGIMAAGRYTMHQLFLQLAFTIAAIGLAVWLSGERPRFLSGTRRYVDFFAYAGVGIVLMIFEFALGQRGDALIGVTIGLLLYMENSRRPRKLRVVAICMGVVLLFGSIYVYRRTPISELGRDVWAGHGASVSEALTSVFASNEALWAHVSLYAVIHLHVPLRPGYSFVSLASSVIPRFLWQDRPPTIYEHYVKSIGAVGRSGYTIHHAAAWYLNGGTAGVGIGAALIAMTWIACFRARRGDTSAGGIWSVLIHVVGAVGPIIVVAYLPRLVRAGPEAYKGLVVEGLIVPICVLVVSTIRMRHWQREREQDTPIRLRALRFVQARSQGPKY